MKPPSKKELLLRSIRALGYMKTSEVIAWGSSRYSNRADRDARQLAKEGLIKRMSPGEIAMRFKNKIKEGVWKVV